LDEANGSAAVNGAEPSVPGARLGPNPASAVFISYASQDAAVADALCAALEREDRRGRGVVSVFRLHPFLAVDSPDDAASRSSKRSNTHLLTALSPDATGRPARCHRLAIERTMDAIQHSWPNRVRVFIDRLKELRR